MRKTGKGLALAREHLLEGFRFETEFDAQLMTEAERQYCRRIAGVDIR